MKFGRNRIAEGLGHRYPAGESGSPVTLFDSNGASAAEDIRREFFACGLDFWLPFFCCLAKTDHFE